MAIMIFGGYFLHCFLDLKNFTHYDYVNPEKKSHTKTNHKSFHMLRYGLKVTPRIL